MSKNPSTLFEQQVERIHQLLEEESSQVTWDDKIPDPDNPEQMRQIDITVKRDNKIVHIECRIHKAPQDVQWIEELIGRKTSLNADAIIAVSSSGFTSGAIKKAARYKIPLHTLQKLTDEEIKLWARPVKIEAIFYEFTDCIITFEMPFMQLPGAITISNENGTPVMWRGLFEEMMKYFDTDQEINTAIKVFDVEIFAPLLVCSIKPLKIIFHASIRRITQELPLDEVLCYTALGEAEIAKVQKNANGTVEVIRTSDEASIMHDAKLTTPPNCFFKALSMDFIVPTLVKQLQLIEPYRLMASDVPIRLCIKFGK